MSLTSRTVPRRGFMLIELLVMIAIIAILAAILFPVFQKVRENARKTACLSNLKQIGLGIIQYQQDYDEKYPQYSTNGGGTGSFPGIQPYLKSTQIYQCPDEPNSATDINGQDYTDYAYNLALGWGGFSSQVVSLAQITNPAVVVMACDESAGRGDHWSTGCAEATACAPGLATFRFDYNSAGNPTTAGGGIRHNGLQNVVLCDGHAKALRGNSSTQSTSIYSVCTLGAAGGVNPGGTPAGGGGAQCAAPAAADPFSGENPTFNYEP